MTMINPPSLEPVEATERRAMTPARRARILKAHDGRCAYPDCQAETGLEIDHEIALELGGKDNDANCRPLCQDHHKQKTRLDAKLIGKMRRRQKKGRGEFPEAKFKLRSRGFPKGRNRQFDQSSGER